MLVLKKRKRKPDRPCRPMGWVRVRASKVRSSSSALESCREGRWGEGRGGTEGNRGGDSIDDTKLVWFSSNYSSNAPLFRRDTRPLYPNQIVPILSFPSFDLLDLSLFSFPPPSLPPPRPLLLRFPVSQLPRRAPTSLSVRRPCPCLSWYFSRFFPVPLTFPFLLFFFFFSLFVLPFILNFLPSTSPPSSFCTHVPLYFCFIRNVFSLERHRRLLSIDEWRQSENFFRKPYERYREKSRVCASVSGAIQEQVKFEL